MKEIRKVITLIAFSLGFITTSAQGVDSEEPKTFKEFINEKVFFGGNFGLQLGTYTFIDISPLIGYNFTDRIKGGVGGTFLYYRDNYYDFSTTISGGRLFGRYYFSESLFGHTEYELLRGKMYENGPSYNMETVLVGAGFNQEIAGNLYFNILGMWAFPLTNYTPYNNPVIRMGVVYGL